MTGIEAALLGAAASGTAAAGTAAAATTGLLGVGGSFSLGATLSTLGAVATGLSAVSSLGAASAQEDMARQQQQQLSAQGDLRRYQQIKANKQIRSRQLAQIGKSGIQLTGSPLQLVQNTAAEQEIDILVDKYNTQLGISDIGQESNLAASRGRSGATQSLIKVPTILNIGE